MRWLSRGKPSTPVFTCIAAWVCIALSLALPAAARPPWLRDVALVLALFAVLAGARLLVARRRPVLGALCVLTVPAWLGVLAELPLGDLRGIRTSERPPAYAASWFWSPAPSAQTVREDPWPAPGHEPVVFFLDDSGRLRFDRKTTTLDGLAAACTGIDETRLRLAAGRHAPLRHVLWILDALEQAGKRRILLATDRFDRNPRGDLGVEHGPARVGHLAAPVVAGEPETGVDGILLEVSVVARQVVRQTHGVRNVGVRYRFAGRETDDLRELGEWLAAAVRACPGARVRGVVRAEPDTTLQYVVAAASQLIAAGAREWYLPGAIRATAAQRGASRLPY